MFDTQILYCVSLSMSLWTRPLQKSGSGTGRADLCACQAVVMATIVEPVASVQNALNNQFDMKCFRASMMVH